MSCFRRFQIQQYYYKKYVFKHFIYKYTGKQSINSQSNKQSLGSMYIGAQLSKGSAMISSSGSDALSVIIIFSSLLELSDDADCVEVAAS